MHDLMTADKGNQLPPTRGSVCSPDVPPVRALALEGGFTCVPAFSASVRSCISERVAFLTVLGFVYCCAWLCIPSLVNSHVYQPMFCIL